MTEQGPASIDVIFERLGGPSSVARLLQVGASTASEMKRRQSIPVKYWPVLISAAQQRGDSLDEKALVEAHCAADIARPAPASTEAA